MKIALIILLGLLAVILVFMTYLLVMPLKVSIDTESGEGMIGWNSWLSAKLTKEKDFEFTVQLPFWKRKFDFFDVFIDSGFKDRPPKKKKEKRRWGKWSSMRWRNMWKAVKVSEIRVDLDTDDFILNAYLVPVFACLQTWTGYNLKINFLGRRELKLAGEARMIEMLFRA